MSTGSPCPVCFDVSCGGEGQGNVVSNMVIISKDSWNRTRAIIPCKFRSHFNDLVGVESNMVSVEGISVDRVVLNGCLYTQRMGRISDDEEPRLLATLRRIKQPPMHVLVHRLTATNVNEGELKIQKKFGEVFELEESGVLNIRMSFDGAAYSIPYKISVDGRVVCKWTDMVMAHDFAVGSLVIFVGSFVNDACCITLNQI
ncbi:hypothetical protein EJB05_57455 [Eragrostis curvula]|uniref:TF-B3 domain-containing protein n=1 Tax=Eragrostis curvula TaxID=38414 RepID=A0A5J9SDE6_9POAL|nr:hypothetical protein EJB05_57455 [Eragrostis curvula]